uniref:Uncharacterized protein n=1 Tax=Arundo donax TaxID=35708 RepID=A0A0A9AZ79_ARUDO
MTSSSSPPGSSSSPRWHAAPGSGCHGPPLLARGGARWRGGRRAQATAQDEVRLRAPATAPGDARRGGGG